MDSSTPRSEVEEHLLRLLQMVNDWLRFAETKNAGLLALSGLSLTALVQFVGNYSHYCAFSTVSLTISGALWFSATLLTAISFLPQTDALNISSRLSSEPDDSDNLYFFGHLAKLEPEGLLASLGLTRQTEGPRLRLELNLAEQVINNSRITNDKLGAFKWATRLWCGGLVTVTLGVLSVLWG